MNAIHPSLLPQAGSPGLLPTLDKLQDAFAPLLDIVGQHARQAARDEYAKLQMQSEDAAAQAQRNEQLVDKHAVAEHLGITPQTVWEYYKKGVLNGSKVGGKILFRWGVVEALVQAQTMPNGRRRYSRRPILNPKSR